MTLKDFTIGQTVYMTTSDRYRRGDGRDDLNEATVTKVGRKYVTVKSGAWECRFFPFRETDNCLTEKVECGTPQKLYATREAYEAQRELESRRDWLRKAADWSTVNKYTLEQLRAVKAILER